MKINGEKVVFGKTRIRTKIWGTDAYESLVKEQRWEIPALDLYGYVEVVFEGRPCSIMNIQSSIQCEVNFDLAQREKRKHGIVIK